MESPNNPPPPQITGADIDSTGDRSTSHSSSAPPPKLPGHYKRNLFFIGLVGVVLCWWVYYFTDLFEIFSSLLALGGIFSWLAFVAKILPDDRLKGLQGWVDEDILARPRAWLVAIVFGVVLCGLAACWGTIEVQALRSAEPVRIHGASAAEEKDAPWELVSAGGRVRFLVWSPPWARAHCRVTAYSEAIHMAAYRAPRKVADRDVVKTESFR